MDMISELRELLDVEPSKEAFVGVMALLFEQRNHSESPVALDYAEQHLESWPSEYRIFHVGSQHTPTLADIRRNPGTSFMVFDCFRLVRRLCLRRRMIKDAGLAQLVQAPFMSNLDAINLWNNQITDEGINALADSPYMANLQCLFMQCNRVGDEGIQALVSSPYVSSLNALNLSSNQITDEGIKALVSSPNMSSLEALFIEDNKLTDASLLAVADSPHMSNLEYLMCADNFMSPVGFEALEASPYLSADFQKNHCRYNQSQSQRRVRRQR